MISKPWYNSLPVQILLLLTLALLPLGAVAIYQTTRVAAEAERNAELALLSVTGRAAKAEELIIARAFGAARLFAAVAEEFLNNPERCTRELGKFVDANPQYSLIGIVPTSGRMVCSSSGVSFDFSGRPGFETAIRSREPSIIVNRQAPVSGTSVFVVSEPFEINGVFAGFITLSIPHSHLPDTLDDLGALGLEELITFNETGDILTTRSSIDAAAHEMPAGRSLSDLKTGRAKAFTTLNQSQERRTYTVFPIEGSPATVLGIWRVSEGLASGGGGLVTPALFPVIMWFASMAVAMLSVYMLVLRHLSQLRRDMDRFTKDRHLAEDDKDAAMPNEILALRQNFEQMTHDILHDEAELEDAVREKGVLVKEIHHRVKNNLQLISSIMNMQIRSAENDETRAVIASLQDRVRSLATIHRDLYQSQNDGRVDAGALLSEILERTFDIAVSQEGAVDLHCDIDPVLLYPDQAVPLSLLAAEATTNIMKYIGAKKGTTPWVSASLKQDGTGCELILSNSFATEGNAESTGVGSDLIDAFTIQLGGKLDVEKADNIYTMRVQFMVAEFVPEPRDF